MEPNELESAGSVGINAAGMDAAETQVTTGIHNLINYFNLSTDNEKLMGFAHKMVITIIIIAAQVFFIWLLWFLFKKLSAKIRAGAGNRIKPLTIKQLKILTVKQIEDTIIFLLKIVKYLITAFQLFITVPIVFSLYPATEQIASTIFDHIFSPLKKILLDMVRYIPNLITIIIILLIAKYILRGLKFFTKQISQEKLKIPGFYPDWAQPTFNILQVLLYAFTLAIVYPYLPGSDSRVFQGVSVFVGIVFSLGSSSAIGNLVAGLVITYMRPFKIGDRIKIKDLTGYVVEKSPFVVRIRNIRNEFVTFPNLTVLNSDIINYSTSGEEEGLVLHAKVTMGYDVPWRDVYDILIQAAHKTPHVEENPKPFVIQTGFEDFYASYELNVYIKEIERVQLIYSLLYQNIQDGFLNAGISMFSPHYISESVPPVNNQNVIEKKNN